MLSQNEAVIEDPIANDSWESLMEDLDRAGRWEMVGDPFARCLYGSHDDFDCDKCKFDSFVLCEAAVFRNIADRIRNLMVKSNGEGAKSFREWFNFSEEKEEA